MAWLFIDSRRGQEARIGLIDPKRISVRVVSGRSHQLLLALKNVASSHPLRRVEGICVVQGPGSFTSIRTGVILANLLARLFQKPLIGLDATQVDDLPALAEQLQHGRFPVQSTVLPVYDAEPDITLPRP